MDKPIGERVAALEIQMFSVLPSLERVEKTQQEILTELARYRGAWGMLLLIISALSAILWLAKDWFVSWFK